MKTLKKIGKVEIDTNHVKDGSDQYGLFKSPSRGIKKFSESIFPFCHASNGLSVEFETLARGQSLGNQQPAIWQSHKHFSFLVALSVLVN